MKIVDVSGFYAENGGGVRSYVRQKFTAAAGLGHDLTVVAPGPSDRTEAVVGGRIIWVASPVMPFDANYHMFWGAKAVWRVLDAAAPDVVEGSSPWRGGWMAGNWPEAGQPGRAVRALVFHQDFIAGYPYTLLDQVMSRPAIDRLFAGYWRYLRRLSGRFDVTVAGGDWLAERLASFGVHRPAAVPLGVEAGRFSPRKRDAALRRRLLAACGLGEDGKLLLAAGRFHPEKRYPTIIRGFAAAKAKESGLGLVIAGDGLARASVEREARRAGNVHLAGAIADRDLMARYYASADALVHGSGAETYGLAVAEAILSGLPVVAPDTGGAADLAGRGRSELYATGDSAACGKAILRALRRDDARAWPRAPIPSAEDHFTALFDLYQDLIDRRRQSPATTGSQTALAALPERKTVSVAAT